MVATSAHHIVRVTVRVDVVSFHRDIDLTLPTSSSFAEILPELSRLIDLPAISRPWEVTTVAGTPLDALVPLYQQRVRDGQILVLRPSEPVMPPVVRDAAQSLAAAAEKDGDIRGLDVVAALSGCAMVAVMIFPFFGVAVGCVVAATAALIASALARSTAMFTVSVLAGTVGAGLWVAGESSEWLSATDPAFGVLAGAAVVATGVGLGVVAKLVDARKATALLTTATLLSLGAIAAWLPAAHAPAAVTVLAGLLTVIAMPGIATRTAGLKVPRVPTAGEDLEAADESQPDVEQRSHTARAVASGVAAGVGLSCIPALVWLGVLAGPWVFAFSLCVATALVVHSFRHHSVGPRTALALTAFAALISCALAVANAQSSHPVWLAMAFFIAALTLTAPLWVDRVPELEPTTLVWLERAEAVALIAALPLAVHLAGVFSLIRGV